MAHIVFMTRGHWNSVTPFIDRLRNLIFPVDVYNDKKDGVIPMLREARLCPIQLWDYTYPKSHQDAVLNTILQGSDGKGIVRNAYLQKYLSPVRALLKLKKIPDYEKDKTLMMIPPQDTEVIALGIRDDKWRLPDGELVDEKDKPELSVEEW